MVGKLLRGKRRDEVLTASFMFFEVKGYVIPSDVAKLFDFDGTVRYDMLNHPEFYSLFKESRIIVQLTPLLSGVGSAVAQRLAGVLTKMARRRKYHSLKKIGISDDLLSLLALLLSTMSYAVNIRPKLSPYEEGFLDCILVLIAILVLCFKLHERTN